MVHCMDVGRVLIRKRYGEDGEVCYGELGVTGVVIFRCLG